MHISAKMKLLLTCASAALFIACFEAHSATQYDAGDPSPDEQLVLEYINRARANPTAEGNRLGININEGLPKNATVQPPLAMNRILLGTSRAHSADMYTRKFFAHDNPDGATPFDRMKNAGYAFTSAGENIAASSNGGAVSLEDLLMADKNYPNRGHRDNLLSVSTPFREIGVGYYAGAAPITGSTQPGVNGLKNFLTQDFGQRSGAPSVLGVVFQDKNNNGFYDIGEGLAGVTITPDSGTFFAVTGTAGGYAFPIGTSGTLILTASGGALAAPIQQTVTLNGQNVKVDFNTTTGAATAPLITSALSASGVVDAPFTYTITASGTPPLTFTTSTLPPGLTLGGDTISGSPTVAGQFSVVLTASNSAGKDHKTLVIDIAASAGPSQTLVDSDGDGFADEIETAAGTNPNDAASTPFGGAPAGPAQPLTVTKLSVKLNFASTGKDSCMLSGQLPLVGGFTVAGQMLDIDVGGIVAFFTLDAKGMSKGATQSAKLTFKSVKGSIPAQTATFSAKVQKTTLAPKLTDEGVANVTTATKVSVTIPVVVLFNVQKFTANVVRTFTAKQDKTGTVK